MIYLIAMYSVGNMISCCWFQGGLTATDVFAVEWIGTGIRHFGMTVSYYGFISDGNCFGLTSQTNVYQNNENSVVRIFCKYLLFRA